MQKSAQIINLIIHPMQQKTKGKKNIEDFSIPNKNRIVILKRDSKEYLRNKKPIKVKNFLQSPINSDEIQYQEKLVDRGIQWWKKIDHRFFREITTEEIDALMYKTTSEQILNTKYPAKKLQTYYDQVIIFNNPFLASSCLLKVLFRSQTSQSNDQNYELVTYTFKEYEHARQRILGIIDKNIHIFSFRYPKHQYVEYEGMQLQKLDIDIVDIENNQQQIKRLLKYDVKNMYSQGQVQRQLSLWNQELERLNKSNVQNWKKMVDKMKIIKKKQKKQKRL